MSDQGGAARAFGGGFFGFFGVLVAIVGLLAALVLWGSFSQSRARAEAAQAELAPDLGSACASALVVAQRRFFGFDKFANAAAPAPADLGGGRFRCSFPNGEAVYALEGRVDCVGRAGCVVLERGTLDGVQLLERRR